MIHERYSYLGHNNPGREPTIIDVIVAVALYNDPSPVTRAEIAATISNISKPTVVRGVRKLLETELLKEGPELLLGHRGRPHKSLYKAEDFETKLRDYPDWHRAVELRKISERLGMDEGKTVDFLLDLGRQALSFDDQTQSE